MPLQEEIVRINRSTSRGVARRGVTRLVALQLSIYSTDRFPAQLIARLTPGTAV